MLANCLDLCCLEFLNKLRKGVMIQNQKGEEMIIDALSPYQVFEYADTKTEYVVIWTKKSNPDECMLLAFYEASPPNRWLDSMKEEDLLELMKSKSYLWIYKGYLISASMVVNYVI